MNNLGAAIFMECVFQKYYYRESDPTWRARQIAASSQHWHYTCWQELMLVIMKRHS